MQTLHHINYRKFRALSLNGKASNCQLGKNQFESGRARLKKIKLIIKCKFDNSKKRLYYKFKKKKWLYQVYRQIFLKDIAIFALKLSCILGNI